MWYMTEERQLMVNAVREFVEKEVKPVAAEIDKTKIFPAQLYKRACQLGFAGVHIPEEYGGIGADQTTHALVLEELAKGCPALGVAMGASNGLAAGLLEMMGTPEQKEKYLIPAATGEIILACGSTEPAGGANHMEFTTTAVLDGDEWIINGNKVLITNAGIADAYVVLAVTSKLDPVTRSGMSCFIIDAGTPGLETGQPENKLGWNGANVGTVSFKNCRIPKENLVGPLDGCLPVMFVNASAEYLSCGPSCLGIAEAAYDIALNYCMERVQMGQSMYDRYQVSRHKLVKMYTEIESLRALVYSTYAMRDAGNLELARCRIIKAKGYEVAEYVCREAIQLMGGVGVIVDTGLERMWRDSKMFAIGGSSIEALMEQVSFMIKNKMV